MLLTTRYQPNNLLIVRGAKQHRDPAIQRQEDERVSPQEATFYTIVYSGREDVSTMSTLDIVADQIKYLTARAYTVERHTVLRQPYI